MSPIEVNAAKHRAITSKTSGGSIIKQNKKSNPNWTILNTKYEIIQCHKNKLRQKIKTLKYFQITYIRKLSPQ